MKPMMPFLLQSLYQDDQPNHREVECVTFLTDEHGITLRRVPLIRYTQMPDFKVILGSGPIHHFVKKLRYNDGQDISFLVGWKIREDGRINKNLFRLCTSRRFAVDMVITQVGEHDEISIPDFNETNRERSLGVISRFLKQLKYVTC